MEICKTLIKKIQKIWWTGIRTYCMSHYPRFGLSYWLESVHYCFHWKFLVKLVRGWNYLSSRSEVFCKKSVLKNLSTLTGKRMCQGLDFNKVAGLRHFFYRTPFLPNASGLCLWNYYFSCLYRLVVFPSL